MTQSGFDPHDPNYCWKLLQLIRAQNNLVGERWRDQYAHLYQLRAGDLGDWKRYHGHNIQFEAQQTRLQSLIDEWNHGPCGNTPLPIGATDWASRADPAIESGDRSLANALNNPPPAQPPTSHQDSGLPGWLIPIAGVAIVGQAIFAPETLPLDVLAA